MSLLGKMAKLDSSLQRGLDNSFAFVFGGKVVPAEIEEALRQEAEDNVTKTYEGTVEVPNVCSTCPCLLRIFVAFRMRRPRISRIV